MKSWIETAGRAGYAAKGLVYVVVGVLSAMAAFGSGSSGATDSSGAVRTLATSWWGSVLLAFVAVGLIGYVLWRAVQTFVDPENKGDDGKGLTTRAVYAASGVAYGLLAWTAIQALVGGVSGGGGSGASNSEASQALLRLPGGRWMLGILGVVVIGRAFAEARKALSADFQKKLEADLGAEARRWVIRIGRFGLSARALVFVIIGGFFIHAAWIRSSEEARGLEGALEAMSQYGGPALMGFVALGLASYGVFQWTKAAYRRMPD